ncbi:type II toxin-antitoxin system prevent-host-death family antitoxin [Methylobacterium sp. SI9]|uniref:type II toxin-antitoxin system prevent-host-death family antitoxin n=1 Tax=Methylobacterium guangdongense TaxID=3138811 RepID=UPI00313B875A
MTESTFTSREFNREPGRIRRAAAEGPVIITEGGKPIMAVLPYGAYARMKAVPGTILDALDMEGVGDIEIDFELPLSVLHLAISK